MYTFKKILICVELITDIVKIQIEDSRISKYLSVFMILEWEKVILNTDNLERLKMIAPEEECVAENPEISCRRLVSRAMLAELLTTMGDFFYKILLVGYQYLLRY